MRQGFAALLVVLAGWFCTAAWAAPAPPVLPANAAAPAGDALQVSVITFGPGRVYWERFGHVAILIRNLATGVGVAYNYGIFNFNQKHFFLNFARGRMEYRMAADPWRADDAFYVEQGRSITEQTLNLTPAQRLSLAQFLAWNNEPENTRYRYDYFLSNCATRVRDAINRVLGGALRAQLTRQPAPPGHTWRFDSVRALAPDAPLAMLMDFVLGPGADQPLNLWQDSFLPAQLSLALDTVRIKDAQGQTMPLVAHTAVLYAGTVPAMLPRPPNWLSPLLAVGLGLAIVLLLLNLWATRGARVLFAILATLTTLAMALAGVLMALIWGVTAHWAGWYNENLLAFDPLLLLLVPVWWSSAKRQWTVRRPTRVLATFITLAALAALVVRHLPGAWQANLDWIAFALPIHVVLLVCLLRAPRRNRLLV
ncbi:MAG TPA: DUF4105 domain-containing protein [Nevskiaceae bacterium]|nr:DUF4105 domain-containing protein [Nevskiaceae bacterium]